jgi:bifunctional non-homologous end joining protein LigD
MPLKDYEEKRDFRSTSEPRAFNNKKGKNDPGPVFVVQKHYASTLHYDFRLELEGVLKSWAVPKGPSMDPSEKHLAVLVEDHPLEYKDFSGTIPEGNYGAGKVEVWDEGTYHAIDSGDKKSSEEKIKDGFKKGHITIILDGSKLKGEFAFIRLKKAKDNDWLLIKKNDDHAVKGWKIDDKN